MRVRAPPPVPSRPSFEAWNGTCCCSRCCRDGETLPCRRRWRYGSACSSSARRAGPLRRRRAPRHFYALPCSLASGSRAPLRHSWQDRNGSPGVRCGGTRHFKHEETSFLEVTSAASRKATEIHSAEWKQRGLEVRHNETTSQTLTLAGLGDGVAQLIRKVRRADRETAACACGPLFADPPLDLCIFYNSVTCGIPEITNDLNAPPGRAPSHTPGRAGRLYSSRRARTAAARRPPLPAA